MKRIEGCGMYIALCVCVSGRGGRGDWQSLGHGKRGDEVRKRGRTVGGGDVRRGRRKKKRDTLKGLVNY